MYTSKTLEYLFQGFLDLFEQSETYCFELHCSTACFIFIICIIIDDFMSYWSWLFYESLVFGCFMSYWSLVV